MYSRDIMHDQGFVVKFKEELAKRPNTNIGYTADELINQMALVLKYYTVFYIVLTIIAIIATIIIKKNVLLLEYYFLLVAIITAVTSGGVLIPCYLLHFIVAIMLFVRKEPAPLD